MLPRCTYALLLLAALAGTGCRQDTPAPPFTFCAPEHPLTDKAAAQAGLRGDWRWLGAVRLRRGQPQPVALPPAAPRIVRFTADRYQLFENGRLVQDQSYDLQYMGEGTNPVDPVLLLRTFSSPTAYSRAIIRLDTGLSCLQLVSSYDDAGDDIYLQRLP